MKAYHIFLLVFLLANFGSLAQSDQWKGPCINKNGLPQDPSDYNVQRYSVKKHKKRLPIEISVNKIMLGKKTVDINFTSTITIKSETDIIPMNDSLGIKRNLARIIENQEKRVLYKLQFLKMEKESNCWRPVTIFSSYYEVYNQIISLSGSSVGFEDKPDYIKIVEGWIKLDPK